METVNADLGTPVPQVMTAPEVPTSNETEARAKESTPDYPEADFFEPIKFTWTKTGFKVRQAVKKYLEESHDDFYADH